MASTAVLSPPTAPTLDGGPLLDNLQDLLRRKREIEKNKSKYHLTESDCSLILTNADEYSFSDGQVGRTISGSITSLLTMLQRLSWKRATRTLQCTGLKQEQ